MSLTLKEVAEFLDCEVLTCEDRLDEIRVESGCAADLMSDVLAYCQSGALLITGLKNAQAIRTADVAEIRAILFVRGKRPDPEAVELAKERGIPLLCTNHFMYEACGILFRSKLKGTDRIDR